MLDLVIIVLVFWWIFKKSNSKIISNITTILIKEGFSHIATVRQNQESYWLSANFHGDNYLFQVMKNGYSVTNSCVNTWVEYATKTHYHNLILIPRNATISASATSVIKQYDITIWDNSKLKNFSNLHTQNTSSIIKTTPTYDTCKIDTPQDPIQNGSKANSILRNLWGNKIERL